MKTYSVKAGEIKKARHVLNADGQVLGILAVEAAKLLMGKHKPMFSRHLDTGDFVVITNAVKVKVTGNKLEQKKYYRHSGYAGGLKTVALEDMLSKKPIFVIEHAVRGMLPRNRLGDEMIKNLKVYTGEVETAKQPAGTVEA
jgi:large subunit ribosomal protein L13